MKRVLIVEDDERLALMLEDMLLMSGYVVDYSATIEGAERVLAQERIDVAVLDIQVGGQLVFPFAKRLMGAEVPFLFASSVAPGDIPADFRWQPLVRKPYTAGQIVTGLTVLLTDSYLAVRDSPMASQVLPHWLQIR